MDAVQGARAPTRFASCLPILLQSPFFFALFRVLNNLRRSRTGEIDPIGPITRELAAQAEQSTFFGAQLSAKFIGADGTSRSRSSRSC